ADMGETDPAQLDRVKNHPFRAPLLVLALTQFQPHPKVPSFEQVLSTGAAIENFLLSLQAQGFSTIWRTGAVIESALFKQALALTKDDLISGIIYIGTAVKAIPARAEIETQDYVSYWNK
ncbi:MAG: nitroreductase family protein, partial [Gammaproteobacteria bacterium]|nr:nitroreductase family protein [Gammaproteobacteria bacterium]